MPTKMKTGKEYATGSKAGHKMSDLGTNKGKTTKKSVGKKSAKKTYR